MSKAPTTKTVNRRKPVGRSPTKSDVKKIVGKATVRKKAAAKADAERARYDWGKAETDAVAGKVPSRPDFSAPTHARYLPTFESIVKHTAAGDIAALKALEINPISSTPKAMDRYRRLCVTALQAKAKA